MPDIPRDPAARAAWLDEMERKAEINAKYYSSWEKIQALIAMVRRAEAVARKIRGELDDEEQRSARLERDLDEEEGRSTKLERRVAELEARLTVNPSDPKVADAVEWLNGLTEAVGLRVFIGNSEVYGAMFERRLRLVLDALAAATAEKGGE